LLFGKEEALSWNKDELARMMMLGIARKMRWLEQRKQKDQKLGF
jgi:predicted thioredoxin/glutaredoxin